MEPYIGEIRIFAGTFAPVGWLYCNGALVQISENPALFQLIGTTYGGDGQTTFAVPNMAGRVVVGQGQAPGLTNYVMGQMQGTEQVTLTNLNLPVHNHPLTASVSVLTGAATGQNSPNQAYFSDKGPTAYSTTVGTGALAPAAMTGTMTPAGSSMPHSNVQPVTAINYIICTEGIYPTQN